MINDLPTGISKTYESKFVNSIEDVNAHGAQGWKPVAMRDGYFLVTREWPVPRTISVSSASRERGGDV